MWNFYQPVDIKFGTGRLTELKKIMESKKLKRALLITDQFLVKTGLAAKIIQLSEGKIVGIASDIEPNPTVENINNCLKEAKKLAIESIVALGGGSSMDCAKSVAAALAMNVSGEELINGTEIVDAFPLLAIPTTAGTGSEVTAGAVISDKKKGIKKAIFGPALFPKVALVDPELTYTCPQQVTASSGIDVIAHALDALTSIKANSATDSLAIYAAKLAFENLEKAYINGNDIVAREKMSEASLVAGLAFSQTGTTGSHACSYILTAKYKVPHGEACAFTLDWWFKENAKVRPILNEYAKMIGFENVEEISNKINYLKTKMGMKSKITEIVKDDSEWEEIITSSLASGNMTNNIFKANYKDIVRLLESKR